MAVTIRKDRVLDNWQKIVDNGSGNRDSIYTKTETYLTQASLPNVTWRRDAVNTGLFKTTREFIVVNHGELREYVMFLCARDYGQHLDCAWYVTCRPGLFKRAVSKAAVGHQNALSLNLDVFNQQDLEAWVSCVHHAFLRSIQELMEELKQDITGMNTRS